MKYATFMVTELRPKPFICVRYVFVTLAETWHARETISNLRHSPKTVVRIRYFRGIYYPGKTKRHEGLNSRINIAADVAVINLPPDFRLVQRILYPRSVVCRIGF